MAITCGYYSCMRGVPTCNKITDIYTEPHKIEPRQCDRCKRTNGGLYPTQVVYIKEDFTKNDCEVVDNKGNILN